MKLTTVTHVSVDGVMQGLGGAQEDRRGGFERGGWAPPLFVDEASTYLSGVFQRADAFLLGRRTYEIFAGSWGVWPDPGDSPIWTGTEHEAQVRGIDHAHQTTLGEYDRPLR
jgi:dihydrofolate reductase